MKKIIILAVAIAAVLALVGCDKKTQPLMPSQSYIGRWSNYDDDDYGEKWDTFVVNRLVKLTDIEDFREFDKGFKYK